MPPLTPPCDGATVASLVATLAIAQTRWPRSAPRGCSTCDDRYYAIRMVRRGCGHEPVRTTLDDPLREDRCPDCGEAPFDDRAECEREMADEMRAEMRRDCERGIGSAA